MDQDKKITNEKKIMNCYGKMENELVDVETGLLQKQRLLVSIKCI